MTRGSRRAGLMAHKTGAGIDNGLTVGVNPWTTPIPASPRLDTNSATWVNLFGGSGGDQFWYNAMYYFGAPIYYAQPGNATYTVTPTGNVGTMDDYNPIRIPTEAVYGPGSDGWLVVIDAARGLAFCLWQLVWNGIATSFTCTNAGVFTWPYDGGTSPISGMGNGAGFLFGAGAITPAEIHAGRINHALALASLYASTSFRYPANKSDGGYGGGIPEGARIQLNPSINVGAISGISAGQAMVGRALQTYGAYIHDVSDHALTLSWRVGDITDPLHARPNTPGNYARPSGAFGLAGMSGDEANNYDYSGLSYIPWDQCRVLAAWDGS